MPVTDADKTMLAQLVVGDRADQCRILLPADGTPQVDDAADDDALRSTSDATISSDGTDTSQDDTVSVDEVSLADAEFWNFDDWTEEYFASPTAAEGIPPGRVRFAGAYWPVVPLMRQNIFVAYIEARAMIASGLQVADQALQGNAVAAQMMTTWFGARPDAVPAGEDWWQGVRLILAKLHRYRGRDLFVYYNGEDTAGQQRDWPSAGAYANEELDEDEVKGYAFSSDDAHDMVIVFHKEYCNRQGLKVATTPAYTNAASVIVHELTHCLAATEDHEVFGRPVNDFGTALAYAPANQAQAWYNAANLEYFCVEAHHGDVGGARAALLQRLANDRK